MEGIILLLLEASLLREEFLVQAELLLLLIGALSVI